MAYLAQDDKQQNPQGQQPQQQNNASMSTGSAGGAPSSGGGEARGGGSSSPAYGAGGGNAWTNIQSYLGANQGNTGSARDLNSQVMNSFNQDRSNLQSQATQAQTQGQNDVNSKDMYTSKAAQLIQDAGNNYNYSGPQNTQFNRDLWQVKNAMNATYGGPTSFNYDISGKSQNYGQNLGNDQGFNGLMQNVYNSAGKGPMNTGMLSLQNQLDTNNAALNNARQNLIRQYAGLQFNNQDTVKNTNDELKADQDAVDFNAHNMRTYIGNQSYWDKLAIDRAVDNFNNQSAGIIDQVKQNPFYSNFNLSAPTANESNVGGVDDKRNQFNVINSILKGGYTPAISRDTPLELGTLINNDNGMTMTPSQVAAILQHTVGGDDGLAPHPTGGSSVNPNQSSDPGSSPTVSNLPNLHPKPVDASTTTTPASALTDQPATQGQPTSGSSVNPNQSSLPIFSHFPASPKLAPKPVDASPVSSSAQSATNGHRTAGTSPVTNRPTDIVGPEMLSTPPSAPTAPVATKNTGPKRGILR